MTLLERFQAIAKGAVKKKTLEQEINESHLAATILKDALFTSIIDDMRQTIINGWIDAPIRDYEGQEKMHMMIKVLNDLIKNIERAYQTGLLAAKEKKEAETKEKKRRK